jgi:RNA polymerase sigma-70 factor (ECF subfamily)
MTWMGEIERWLVERGLPFAPDYRRLATRLVGKDEADDVVQDAYARLITYERWREVENPRAMCLRTVRNLALDRLRSADVVHIDRIVDIESLHIADDRPDAFRESAGRLEAERLMALIDRLPAQCGRVVRMRKIEGRSPREIAVSLGLSVSTVEKHLAKVLELVILGLRERPAAEVVKSREWLRRRTRK